jgi:hypothetical protein
MNNDVAKTNKATHHTLSCPTSAELFYGFSMHSRLEQSEQQLVVVDDVTSAPISLHSTSRSSFKRPVIS